MAEEEHVTDKHDESDTAQFGDDPHNLKNTPFEEASCVGCGTYVVRSKTYQGDSRCLGCAQTHAGVIHSSGQPIGEWHPAVGYPTTRNVTPRKPENTKQEIATWAWGCIECQETGTALNPDHATAMHKTHIGYSCPRARGISILEMKHRLERRAALTRLWPQTTPPMHLKQWDDGRYTAETRLRENNCSTHPQKPPNSTKPSPK